MKLTADEITAVLDAFRCLEERGLSTHETKVYVRFQEQHKVETARERVARAHRELNEAKEALAKVDPAGTQGAPRAGSIIDGYKSRESYDTPA